MKLYSTCEEPVGSQGLLRSLLIGPLKDGPQEPRAVTVNFVIDPSRVVEQGAQELRANMSNVSATRRIWKLTWKQSGMA